MRREKMGAEPVCMKMCIGKMRRSVRKRRKWCKKMRGQCRIRWMRERSAEYVCMKMCIRKTGRSVRKNREDTTKKMRRECKICVDRAR